MKTAEEILTCEEASRKAFEASTIYKGFTIADLRLTSESIFDKNDWKKPWSAKVPYHMVSAVYTAVEFFHADKPTIDGIEPAPGNGRIILSGHGYQGLRNC